MKINKRYAIVSILFLLIPILLGLGLWRLIPDQIATHFTISGEVTTYSSKLSGIFLMNGLFILGQLILIGAMASDQKARAISKKVEKMLYFMLPCVSFFVNLALLGRAFHIIKGTSLLVVLMIAMLLIGMGNYFPKSKQNGVVGIRLPWTLASEENWYKTHRLAGKVWVLAGIFLLLFDFLGCLTPLLFFLILLVAFLYPVLYSYRLHLVATKLHR